MGFQNVERESFFLRAEEIKQLICSMIEERHSNSNLAEHLFLVEIHPQFRIAYNQIIVIIHERSISFTPSQWVELFLLQVEQQ